MEVKPEWAESALDLRLRQFCGSGGTEAIRERCEAVLCRFQKTFGTQPEALFSAPGRTELGGNHTDHQHGCVLAASVDLDLLAAVRVNRSGVIRVCSEGYPPMEVKTDCFSPVPEEKGTSAALIRGVASRMAELGCRMEGAGLDAYVISEVPGGSGLSSSAAFEVLIGTIINDLFGDGRCSPEEIARAGRYAENVFFGKPCGLMDQMASAVGGVVAIDFENAACPAVERIPLDLAAEGYALCILDSGADHADLTAEYAAITEELRAVCGYFGKTVLREVEEAAFFDALPALRAAVGDRAVLRAMHVYEENRRARQEADALKHGDFAGFLELVRRSSRSSALYLQNVVAAGNTKRQELLVTIALCERILGENGAVRVHGGGFGGTAQAFVPIALLEEFRQKTETVLGSGSCRIAAVRPVGGVRII